MSTTVIISGHLRTFDRCLASQHWQVFRHLDNPRFVVSAVDDEDAHKAELLRARYPHAQVDIERVTQPDITEPEGEPQNHAPYAISVPVQAVLRQLWHLHRAFTFAQDCGAIAGASTVIRCRPDIHFQTEVRHAFMPSPYRHCYVPWWGGFGGVNDRFAIMCPVTANRYFTTFGMIPDLLAAGCPLHPESLVAAALEWGAITIKRTLPTMFATLRANGELRHPEILPHELATYARH